MHLSRSLGAAALGLVTAGLAQPAFGFAPPLGYNDKVDPLTAYDGSKAQAYAHGAFSVEDAAYLRNDSAQKDPRPGGDKVFVRTEFRFLIDSAGGMTWKEFAQHQTAKTDSATWSYDFDRYGFVARADKGRMRAQVCEDHGLMPDPCSVWPQYTTDL